jgi:hypothetical protein
MLYAYAKIVLEKKLDSGNMAMGTAGEGSASHYTING